MSTRQNYSEIRLAEIVCEPLRSRKARILVGGLGFGFTLQAVLDAVSPESSVVVAELLPIVIQWNQDESLPLAHKTLKDPRVQLIQQDVGAMITQQPPPFDAIILDVDNGPDGFTVDSNTDLYSQTGLQKLTAALHPGGTLGIWSASSSPTFEKTLAKAGLKVRVEKCRSRPGNKGATHTLFLGQRRM